MSQEGASLPQEVEESHDQATAPHGSIPAGVVGSPPTTVTPAGSNSSSVTKLASTVNNGGSSEHASPAVHSTGEDGSAASKIASLAVLQVGEDSSAVSKIARSTVLLAGEENKGEFKLASPAVLLAGKEKGNDAAGSKLASPTMLQDCDNSKAGSHAGVDNNVVRSKLVSPAVLHASDGNNGGSKQIASPVVPHAIVDNTTGSKLDSPATLRAADEHNNTGFKVPNPAVLHASKDTDSNAGQPKFVGPVLLHAGEDNRARNKLAIQAVSHAGGNVGSSRLTRSAAAAAALQAAKDSTSKLSIQVVPRLHAGKDNNAVSSKAATRPAAVDAGANNAKEGKNNVSIEQQPAHEVDVGGGSGEGNATPVEDADPNLHIFTERERRKKMKNMFSTLHALLPKLPNKADKATIVGEAVSFIKTLEGTVQRLEKLKMERKRALAAQQQHGQQQLVVGAGSSSHSATAHPPAPALPVPAPAAPASSSREANLADMVHGLEAQLAAVNAANKALVTAVAAASAGGSSYSGAAAQLPRGAVPFPAPAAGFQTWTGQNVVVSVANNEAYINLHCPRELGTLTKALFVLEKNHIEVITTTISTQDGFRMYGIHARVNPPSASARFPENLCAEDRFKLAVSEMVQLINNQI